MGEEGTRSGKPREDGKKKEGIRKWVWGIVGRDERKGKLPEESLTKVFLREQQRRGEAG